MVILRSYSEEKIKVGNDKLERIVHGTYFFFVQNLKVILRNLLSEDKDDYFALYQQNSIFKKKKKKEFRDFFEA